MVRTGTIYIIVLGASLIVTVVGLSALTLARINTRTIVGGSDWAEAGVLATSAVEHALAAINANGSWRTTYVNGQDAPQQTFGRGTFSWQLVDDDGSLSDDNADPVRIYGIGRVGDAVRVYSVLASPGGTGLPVLKTAVHSSGHFQHQGTTTASGGPLSTNGTFQSGGTIGGNVEAATYIPGAIVTGTVTAPAPAKTMPSSSVFDAYKSLATTVAFGSVGTKMNPKLLSAAYNPYGSPNASGVYYLAIPSSTSLDLEPARIRGTLVIQGGTNSELRVRGPTLWQPHRADFPILITKNVTLRLSGSSSPLTEAMVSFNLNPPGTPYNGHSDVDMLDSYPSRFEGLIHVINGAVRAEDTLVLTGTIVCAGTIETTGTLNVSVDPMLWSYPPTGYSANSQMLPTAASWRWDALP